MKISFKCSSLLLVVTCCTLMFFACASNVNLNPRITDKIAPIELSRRIGIYHSPDFINYRASVDAYGNEHEFVLPIGLASDKLFKDVYPKIFKNFQYVEDNKNAGDVDRGLDVILEPEIEAFNFPLQSLKGPYWTEVIYRFTLYSQDRSVIFSWNIKGWGESGDGTIYGEFGPIANSVELALSNATQHFVDSFRNIPEIKRWSMGKPVDDATAPLQAQRILAIPDLGGYSGGGTYDRVITVRADFPSFEGQDLDQSNKMKNSGLTGVKVSLTNEGGGLIVFDPTDFWFVTTDNQRIDPVPASFIAALLTTRYVRLPGLGFSSGPYAIANLLIGLVNATEDNAERKDLQNHINGLMNRELHEEMLNNGASTEGLIFLQLPSSGILSGELKVPIINIDTSTRYIVTVPLNETTETSLPEQQGP